MALHNELKETRISCPYCGEHYTTLVEPSHEPQHYIEDCQICCSPIVFNIQNSDENTLEISLSQENN